MMVGPEALTQIEAGQEREWQTGTFICSVKELTMPKKIHRTKATFSFFCEQEVDLCSFVFLVETELKSEMTSGSMV